MPLEPVPAGQIACIVTSLEMRAQPRPAPMPSAPFRLVRWRTPATDAYRALFRRIGAPWLWFSRLALTEDELRAIIHDPAVEIFAAVDRAGVETGLLELDFRRPGACEIAFLGLIPELAGKGHGRWLMHHALAAGWRAGVDRLWVHTCTLDHPSALDFYRRAGFTPFAHAVETFADPRIVGVLPRNAAPHIPLIEPTA